MLIDKKIDRWLRDGKKIHRPPWDSTAYLVLRGDHIVNDRGEKVKFDNINSLEKEDYEIYEDESLSDKIRYGYSDKEVWGKEVIWVKNVKKFIKDDWKLIVDYIEGELTIDGLVSKRNKLIGDKLGD